jgi:hypothetical protein
MAPESINVPIKMVSTSGMPLSICDKPTNTSKIPRTDSTIEGSLEVFIFSPI